MSRRNWTVMLGGNCCLRIYLGRLVQVSGMGNGPFAVCLVKPNFHYVVLKQTSEFHRSRTYIFVSHVSTPLHFPGAMNRASTPPPPIPDLEALKEDILDPLAAVRDLLLLEARHMDTHATGGGREFKEVRGDEEGNAVVHNSFLVER